MVKSVNAASDHGNVSVASKTHLSAVGSAFEVRGGCSPVALLHQSVELVETSEAISSRSHVVNHVSRNILGSLAIVERVAEELGLAGFGMVEFLVEQNLAFRLIQALASTHDTREALSELGEGGCCISVLKVVAPAGSWDTS